MTSFILTPPQNIFYFPIWWYTKGFKNRVVSCGFNIKRAAHNLALKIMLRYLFQPMFGQTSRSGRIISFFMRVVLLVWRLILFAINSILQVAILILWIGVLPAIIYFIIRMLSA